MTQSRRIDRRTALGLAAASFAQMGFAGRGYASQPGRLVALDWGVAETLVALGHPPIGAAEIPSYDRTVVATPMPAGVVDVGLRLSPNPELMQSLAPDLILINAAQAYMKPMLAPFGASEIVAIYTRAGEPYRLAGDAARTLARLTGDPDAADRLMLASQRTMDATRARLAGYDGRPILLIEFIDARHVVAYGRTSLFQGVLDKIGLKNAWTSPANDWGSALAGVEQLASLPEARVLYLTPLPPTAQRTLSESPLWSRLPFVREARVSAMPSIWPFGALPSAMRIARLLGETLAPALHG